MTAGSPAAEVDITEGLIRDLLRAQHPDLAGLPVRFAGEGWDNVVVRLGDDLVLRLPRRNVADQLLRNEQRWLPELAPLLPLPVPVPLRTGVPGEGYPYVWSVLRWIEGETADLAPPEASEAPVLAGFLKALHRPAPDEAPSSDVRGCPLSNKLEDIERRMAVLAEETHAITPAIRQAWRAGLAAPIDLPRLWVAGDVHARNVLVRNGEFAAFIDWGDLCAGDPASDLASIWGLFESADARRAAIDTYGMSDATLARARGWAVMYGVLLLETGRRDHPAHAKMGADTLRRLTEDLT
nr:aminoglycoside phosphotransferase family protein [uncultured Hyphomonas sp.]